MDLLIIRHADPDYEHNTITDFGKTEAEALAAYLDSTAIDEICVSPLGRAIDTAEPTCRNKSLGYTVLPWTAESMSYMRSCDRPNDGAYSFSITEGVTDFNDFTDAEREGLPEQLVAASDSFLAEHGYVREGARYRVTSPNNRTVAVFCHGGFGAAWISHLMLRPPELGWLDIRLRTTSITRFRFSDEPSGYTFPVLYELGSVTHIVNAGLRINTR